MIDEDVEIVPVASSTQSTSSCFTSPVKKKAKMTATSEPAKAKKKPAVTLKVPSPAKKIAFNPNGGANRDRISQMWGEPYKQGSNQHKRLTRAVALFLLEDGLPAYTVERRGLAKLLKVFDKRLVHI